MKELRIALVQMRCEKGEIHNNLNTIEMYIKESKTKDVNVVCFPEMNITGYLVPSKFPDKIQNIYCDSIKQIMEWSKTYNLVIIVGFIEENPNGRPFITQIAVKDGNIVCLYRKRTIVDEEADWFSKGEELATFSYRGINIGLAICADIGDESIFREYKQLDVDLVFECAAPGLYGSQNTRNWQSGYEWWKSECYKKLGRYAGENQIYIAVATQAGRTVDEDFPGGGYFFSSNGNCINETSDWRKGILYGTLYFR